MFVDESMFGIKFDVSGDEIRSHCEKKAEYHQGRMKFYEEQVAMFKDEIDEIAKDQGKTYSNTTAVSNKQRMESSKSHHSDRVRFFKFAATHLKDKDYKLRQSELVNFEMIPG